MTARVPACVHRSVSAEAVSVATSGREAPSAVHLCDWPDAYPDRLIDAPRWLNRLIGSGIAIDPERDCVKCPARTLQSRPQVDA